MTSLIRFPRVPGTKNSIHNSQLFTSTGVDSLDQLIGGGITVGSVVLIEEDDFSTCSKLLVQYFFAEGYAAGQKLFLSSKQPDSLNILKNLPQLIGVADKSHSSEQSQEAMKIAFQYQHLPTCSTVKSLSKYDLSKIVPWEMVEKTNPTISILRKKNILYSSYDDVINDIQTTIVKEGSNKRLLRIVLHSLNSPCWYNDDNIPENSKEFCQFLYKLRALMRYSLAVCYITIPSHLNTDLKWARSIRRFCDTILKLESFDGKENLKNPLLKNYLGILHIIKLPSINSQTCFTPACKEYGYKIERKRLIFEILHLPPLFETSKEEKRSCGGHASSKLDF